MLLPERQMNNNSMERLQSLSKAIDYIEENLDKEISVDEAALIACYSTFYFKRMFACITGISLSEYIRLRRMTQAAFERLRTDQLDKGDMAVDFEDEKILHTEFSFITWYTYCAEGEFK